VLIGIGEMLVRVSVAYAAVHIIDIECLPISEPKNQRNQWPIIDVFTI